MQPRIALITPPTESHRTAEETLALGYLGGSLQKAGYEVLIADGWLERLSADDIIARISAGAIPALVGMSCYRSNLEQAVEILKLIKKSFGNIPLICGGYGPTFHAKTFLEGGFTAAVVGEAEHIIVPLTDALLNQSDLMTVPGIAFMREGMVVQTACVEPLADLDQIAFPLRETVKSALAQRNFVHLCTSRGCEAFCGFCSIFSFALNGSRKLRWRQRSISNIVDEIEGLHQQFGATHFKFVDDSFIEPPREEQWAYGFGEELRRRGLSIRFRTQVRADRLTPGIVRVLKEVGWFSTSVGVENASATALKRMLKSALQVDNLKALEMLEGAGIYVQMGMILFDPHTTMAELRENMEFLKRNRWPVTKGIFTEMFAAEGTPFTKKLKRKDLVVLDLKTQNYAYAVQDIQARRVYAMLKLWHRSHSHIYDWVIDSLTSPKVLTDEGYVSVHVLYQELQTIDLWFFEAVLEHVSETADSVADEIVTSAAIEKTRMEYEMIRVGIENLYAQFGLQYDAVPNPFLGLA